MLGFIQDSATDEFIHHAYRAQAFLNLVVHDNARLKAKTETLLSIAKSSQQPSQSWTGAEIHIMEERLRTLVSSVPSAPRADSVGGWSVLARRTDSSSQENLPPGWKRVDPDQWKCCPIGIFVAI